MLEQQILPGIRFGRRWIITRHAYEQWERTCGMRAGAGLAPQTEVTVLNESLSTNANIDGEKQSGPTSSPLPEQRARSVTVPLGKASPRRGKLRMQRPSGGSRNSSSAAWQSAAPASRPRRRKPSQRSWRSSSADAGSLPATPTSNGSAPAECGLTLDLKRKGNGVELMSVHKRKYRSGKTVWSYQFALPGATRQERNRIFGNGFATKREAEDAEAKRRIEEQQQRDLAKAGASIAAAPPKTLSTLLEEFIRRRWIITRHAYEQWERTGGMRADAGLEPQR